MTPVHRRRRLRKAQCCLTGVMKELFTGYTWPVPVRGQVHFRPPNRRDPVAETARHTSTSWRTATTRRFTCLGSLTWARNCAGLRSYRTHGSAQRCTTGRPVGSVAYQAFLDVLSREAVLRGPLFASVWRRSLNRSRSRAPRSRHRSQGRITGRRARGPGVVIGVCLGG